MGVKPASPGPEAARSYEHPLYDVLLKAPGLSVAVAPLDDLLAWGLRNALWVFPMATSCCGIELMAAAASRVDLDRMGTIVRGTPRQADVMVVAGTITVKMAPRVKKLWDQMPEPKWCVAMGSCAISGDFYRDLYATIPGIDTVVPVDVYVPGCPPNPEALMHGLLRLQEKVQAVRAGLPAPAEPRPETAKMLTVPAIRRLMDPERDRALTAAQVHGAGLPSPDAEAADIRFELPVLPPAPAGVQAPAGEIEQLLAQRFGVTEFPKDGPPVVPAARHLEVAAAFAERGYRLLAYVVAWHRPASVAPAPAAPPAPAAGAGVEAAVTQPSAHRPAPQPQAEDETFEVAYGLRRLGPGTAVASWKVKLKAGESVPSLAGMFPAADWQEREQYDLVGVRFEGHPDLRRIMMPEDWVGHPLRRDYPSDTACAPWR